MPTLDPATADALDAAAFRRLLDHLRTRHDVQNIDLMNLAGFCRNCLGNWVEDAARERGVALTRAQAREHVYGMPQEEWKRRYQRDAEPAAQAAFAATHADVVAEQAAVGEGEAANPSPS